MDMTSSEETQVLRENYRVGNEVKVTEASSGISVSREGGDVTFWRKEYDKARLSESQARSDANTFLQCYSELEDVAQRTQTENQSLQKKLKASEYQLEAAQREVEKWKSEYDTLAEERTTKFEPKCLVDCSVQVWETEFEKCDFSLFASTVDTGQQTDALDVIDDEDSNRTTEEIRDVLGSCIQQVRDATCTLLEAQEKDKVAVASNGSAPDQEKTEDKTRTALEWEQSQIQLSIEQMQKQEHELRNTLQLLIAEIESAKKTYDEVQLDHNRYLHDIDARFRKHTSELDEIARVAERYAATAEIQQSRAEFFKAKANEQKQILVKSAAQRQKGTPADTDSFSLTTVQKSVTELSDKFTETEFTDHCPKADPQKLEVFLYKQQQLMFEKDAEVYYWKSQSRKTQLNEVSDSIRGPGIGSLLDDAAGDLEVIEAEILTAVEKRSGIASELAELSLQKQQTRDEIKELKESKITIEDSVQVASAALEKHRALLKGEKSDFFKLKEETRESKSEVEILSRDLEQKRGYLRALETEIEAKKSSLQNEIQQQIAAKHEAECAQEEARQKQGKLKILTNEVHEQQRLLQANKQRLEEERSLLEERRVSQLDIEKLRTTIDEEKCRLQALHVQKAELLKSIDDLSQRRSTAEEEKQLTEKRKVASMSDVAIQCRLKRDDAKPSFFAPKRPTVSYSYSNESVSSESACSTQGNDSVERPLKPQHKHRKTFELEGEEIYARLRALVRLIRDASKEHDRCLITNAFRKSVSLIHELCQLYTEAKTKIQSLWKTIENGTKRMKAIEQKLSFIPDKT